MERTPNYAATHPLGVCPTLLLMRPPYSPKLQPVRMPAVPRTGMKAVLQVFINRCFIDTQQAPIFGVVGRRPAQSGGAYRKSQRVKLPFLSGDGFPYPTPLFPPGPNNLSSQPQVRVVLQNVTATINMRIAVDVSSLANKVRNAEYNPKKLPAVVSESGLFCCCCRRH